MNDEPQIENEQDKVSKIEQPGSKIESKAEDTEEERTQAAEILESPQGGLFANALRALVDLVKRLRPGK